MPSRRGYSCNDPMISWMAGCLLERFDVVRRLLLFLRGSPRAEARLDRHPRNPGTALLLSGGFGGNNLKCLLHNGRGQAVAVPLSVASPPSALDMLRPAPDARVRRAWDVSILAVLSWEGRCTRQVQSALSRSTPNSPIRWRRERR